MADNAPNSDVSATPAEHELPERLRVHSLARVLGTTSRRVLDALIELDGRVRSAQSSIDRGDAVRVRDLLVAAESASAEPAVAEAPAEPAVAEAPAEPAVAEASAEPAVAEAPVEPAVAEAPAEPAVAEAPVEPAVAEAPALFAEPESRLLLEPAPEPVSERPGYMPLFVAPQPVSFEPRALIGAGEEEAEEESAEAGADIDDDEERPANRRRRRGRRGRGRGRGSGEGDEGETGESDQEDIAEEAADLEAEPGTEGEEGEEGEEVGDEGVESAEESGNRRRRRRRRRKTGSGDDDAEATTSPDDPPNTVVHERTPRTKSVKSGRGTGDDEIQGINGSTRLEAKRQRRRDGRDAGRRRPPILSEAEFLARREAVERVMVVRDRVRTEPPHQGARYTQIAVLEDGVMVEHFVTSAASQSLVGNVYLGIVQNVLPSMEAAFVDIGRGRNGVLYAGEVNWEAAGLGGANRKIEQALKPGDYVVVQVSKDPIGHKGARLTTQISLAGRYLVYVPGASSTGISRKLPDTERQRLKEILREVVPADAGVIIRTASEGVKEEDIRADVERLQQRWTEIEATAVEIRGKAAGAAVALYEEPDVLVKVIRDLFNEDFSKLVVSGDDAWETINDYVGSVAPELMSKLTRYSPPAGSDGQPGPDVFAVHRIDEQLAKAMDRKVWLPSGGTLVIDRTEAMTVVDVNTGKFTGSGGNLEETVTRNNLEAAEETVRQLRLRDIGGIIVIDFIDMVLESNRDLVLRRLTEALGRDRTRHQVSEVTSLGLVQLTRKRLGTGLVEAFSTSCPQCAGRGIMLHADPVDSAAPGRKPEASTSSSRRSKRTRKAKVEEPVMATIPAHTPGDHPMFKAMAAAGDHHDDEAAEEPQPGADELAVDVAEQVAAEVADEDLIDDEGIDEGIDEGDDEGIDEAAQEDVEDEGDLDADEDEVDLDGDDDDDDEFDDDLDVIDEDAGEGSDEEPDDASDAASDGEAAVAEAEVVLAVRPRRRRAAARPAGPPR